MSTVLAFPAEIESVLALKTVREGAAPAEFLAAMRECARDDLPFTVERLQALLAIEEHFQALLLYDQIEFLRAPPPPTAREREFALAIQRICVEAANGFQRFLRNRAAWADSPDAAELRHRVTGLALNAIHALMKWGYFLDEAGRNSPWKQLHTLLQLAEQDGYAQVPLALHPSQPSFKPTVRSLYLRTLLLDLLNTGSLTKIQIEIADGWLASWCLDYSLEGDYSPRHHLFFVDPAAASGMRMVRRDSPTQGVRFLRADGLAAQLGEIQAGLRHGRLYAGHGAGAVFPVEQHAALLTIIEKLHQSLLAGADSRIEERQHFEDREVDVTVGYERVLARVRAGPRPASAPAAPAASLSETIEISAAGLSLVAGAPQPAPAASALDDPEVERWRVHDLSSNGFGLVVDRAAADAVPLNGLLALHNQQTGGWIVGSAVRKIASRVRGEMLIGVEVLSYRPIALDLAPAAGGDPVPALFLPGADTGGRLDALVVRAGEFASDNSYVIRAGGADYGVRLNRIIRKGADWLKARFEIESKKA